PKRHTKSATMKASKRWFPDAKTSSKVSQNTNLRCAKLEEECKSFFRLDEKYTAELLTLTKRCLHSSFVKASERKHFHHIRSEIKKAYNAEKVV
ncbi:hypothetical protein TNCT_416851, partial [Trichonephila clavata]